MPPMLRAVALVALVALLPAAVLAQKPFVIAKPDVELAEPFSNIVGIRELKDGRVIVGDGRDKTLQVIDLKSGAATKVAREGQGPGELGNPLAIVALPGDSAAVWDGGNVRYLLVHPDGKAGKDFKFEPAGGPGRQTFGLTARPFPRGVDSRGSIYVQGSSFALNAAGEMQPTDSSPVIRLDRAALRLDTLAYIKLAKGTGNIRAMPDGSTQVTTGGANPLEPRDGWGVLPDGRIAIVRGADYHVDFVGARGARTSGPAVPYEKFAVTDAVKELVEEARERQRKNAMGTGSGRGGQPSASPPPAPGRGPLRPLANWPDFVPAFQDGAVVVRPMGAASQVWVMRTLRPGAQLHLYDVFDGTGRVITHVQLPPNTRLVGFGAGTIYLVRTDADDLQFLQRHKLADIPR